MTDVFSEKDGNDNAGNNEQGETKQLLDELVGEGKKYKDVEALAKSRIEADTFINQLKEENKGMREELEKATQAAAKAKTMDELFEALNKKGSTSESSEDDKASNQSGISREDLKEIVRDMFQETRTEETAEANYRKANEAVVSYFKNDTEKAREHIKAKASELGMPLEDLKSMARQRPNAFLKLIDVTNDAPASSGSGSMQNYRETNSEASMNRTEKRNAAYYNRLRRELKHGFWKPEIQNAMMEDRKRLGEDFYK